MINVTLRQLRYFAALVRHGHFGRAAEACSISQPALSMQIKEMEETLGGVLLERRARQIALTKFGEELLYRVRDILRSVDELGDFARASRDRLAAIVALPVSEPSLAEVALFQENFLLVRTAEHEGAPVPSRETLREMKLLLLEEGLCFRDQALSFCNLQSSPPREMLDASSLSTLVQMVGAGIGVTLIPEMAVEVETRSASVSVVRFKNPQPSRPIGIAWRQTNPLARQLEQISEVVCLAAGKTGGRRSTAGGASPRIVKA